MKTIEKQNKKLAKKIKLLREKIGLSQSELANRLGKDKQWMQRIESGKHKLRNTTLDLVASGLEVSVKYFKK